MIQDLSPEELKARLDAGEKPLVIDVREAWELEKSALVCAKHMPMGSVVQRLGELDPAMPIIIMCRSGGRSMQVAHWLEAAGFQSVANLTGGILAWGERIDLSLRPY